MASSHLLRAVYVWEAVIAGVAMPVWFSWGAVAVTGYLSYLRDVGIITLSIVIAIILGKIGVLAEILTSTQEWGLLGSLVSGIFFVSIFTAAPAGVMLFKIAAVNPI